MFWKFFDPQSSFKIQYVWVKSKLHQFLAKHVDLPVENGYRALTEEEKDAILPALNIKTLELFKYIETIEKNSGKIIFGPEEAITLELLIKKCQEIKEAIEAPDTESKEEENSTKELKDTADEGDIFDAKDLISQAIDHGDQEQLEIYLGINPELASYALSVAILYGNDNIADMLRQNGVTLEGEDNTETYVIMNFVIDPTPVHPDLLPEYKDSYYEWLSNNDKADGFLWTPMSEYSYDDTSIVAVFAGLLLMSQSNFMQISN